MKTRLFIALTAVVLLLRLAVSAVADGYAPSYWDPTTQSYLYY